MHTYFGSEHKNWNEQNDVQYTQSHNQTCNHFLKIYIAAAPVFTLCLNALFSFWFFLKPLLLKSVVGLDWSANQSVVIGLLLRACVGKVKPLSIIGMLYLQKHCKYYCNYANLHMWDLWWTFQNTTFFIRLLHSGSPCNNVFQKQRFLNSLTTTFVWGWAKIVNRRCYANVLHAVVTLLK